MRKATTLERGKGVACIEKKMREVDKTYRQKRNVQCFEMSMP